MHQNQFRLGLRPKPRWGSLQRSPDPIAGFKRPTSIREGEGGEEKGRRRKGKGREGSGIREGRGPCLALVWNLRIV